MIARRGVVLAAVMIVTALAGMVAVGLLFRMRASVSASVAVDNGEQAYAAAMSGINRAVMVLNENLADMDFWYDNPAVFKNQKVYDDGGNVWYFSVYGPDPLDATKVRYGLNDEAGRININEAQEADLRAVLADEMVACLLDYRDGDDEQRELGAEQEYYERLPYPYLIRNGPLTTVEELLLVKGFGASAVYGEDVNLNGLMDPNEDDGEDTFPVDNADGNLDLGMLGLTTTFSYTPSLTRQGDPQISMANGDPQAMDDAGLSSTTVGFIEAYRADAGPIKHPSQLLNARHRLRQDRELWNGEVYDAETVIESGVTEEELPDVLDLLTGSQGGPQDIRHGIINVNTAPARVLASVDGIGPAAAERIVTERTSLDSQAKSTTAWLYTRGILVEEDFKRAAPKLTALAYQFRVRCIGFGMPCQRIRVIEAVIDMAGDQPRFQYLRDLTRLGVPFAMDLDSLVDEEAD